VTTFDVGGTEFGGLLGGHVEAWAKAICNENVTNW
jgi:hypothetical protein